MCGVSLCTVLPSVYSNGELGLCGFVYVILVKINFT